MHESEPDKQFSAELVNTGPGIQDVIDVLMIQTSLLMRIYDVQMALLGSVDNDTAKELWAEHNVGGHRNPVTMVPVFGESDEEANS